MRITLGFLLVLAILFIFAIWWISSNSVDQSTVAFIVVMCVMNLLLGVFIGLNIMGVLEENQAAQTAK